MLPEFVIAVDLGQMADFTAICALSRRLEPTGRAEPVLVPVEDAHGRLVFRQVAAPQYASHYDILHLQRLPLGTPYVDVPAVVQAIDQRLREGPWMESVWQAERAAIANRESVTHHPLPEDAPVVLAVDSTGVGKPVVELLKAHGLAVNAAITITAGAEAHPTDDGGYHVPKRELVSGLQVALQERRIRVASDIPEWPALMRELTGFRAKINGRTGNTKFEAGDDWRSAPHDDLLLSLALGLWAAEHARRPGLDPTIAAAFYGMPN